MTAYPDLSTAQRSRWPLPQPTETTPPSPLVRVLVTGSRTLTDPRAVRAALTHAWRDAGQPIVVVHGACGARRLRTGEWDYTRLRGADRWADEWTLEHMPFTGCGVERHPADWDRHGRSAGPRRNVAMVKLGAWRVLGFPVGPSIGTRHCLRVARAAGLDVRTPEVVA